jgi:hypothetical protein
VLRGFLAIHYTKSPSPRVLGKFAQLSRDLKQLLPVTGRFYFPSPLLALGGKLGQRLVIVHDYASTT